MSMSVYENMNQLCKVCGEPAAGFHFGAFTCEGCKSFFGRTYNNVSGISECKNGGRCEITKKNRTSCKQCRLRKCLSVGMSKSGSRYGRRSNWFKIHCLLSAQSQNGGGGPASSEANNNNSTATNNNNLPSDGRGFGGGAFAPNSLGKSPSMIPSTVTSEERERDFKTASSPSSSIGNREKVSSSLRNGASSLMMGSNGGLPATFSSIAGGLSPESREQFLASLSLNRNKLINPELAEYFRLAQLGAYGGFPIGAPLGKSASSMMEREDDMISRTTATRSPGSIGSPNNSDGSGDEKETKMNLSSHNQMFGLSSASSMPSGSPTLEVNKPDLLSFDFFTRDLIKMGYDPMRLWPAMMAAGGGPHNLHNQFNPYRFMFPGGFPGAALIPGGGVPGFPPNVAAAAAAAGMQSSPPASLLNGGMHSSKLLSAVSGGLPEGGGNITAVGAGSGSSLLGEKDLSSRNYSRQSSATPTSNHSISPRSNHRVTPIVPPSSSLTLTPPISHYSPDEDHHHRMPSRKFKRSSSTERGSIAGGNVSQDTPIDLSAKSTNNNYVDDDYQQEEIHKKFGRFNGSLSPEQSDSEEEHVNPQNLLKRGEFRHQILHSHHHHHHHRHHLPSYHNRHRSHSQHHHHHSDKEFDSEAENDQPQSLIKKSEKFVHSRRRHSEEEESNSRISPRQMIRSRGASSDREQRPDDFDHQERIKRDDHEDDENDDEGKMTESKAEDLRRSSNNNNELKDKTGSESGCGSGRRRRSSSGSREVSSPKRERVSDALDLTRSTNSTPVAPQKIAI